MDNPAKKIHIADSGQKGLESTKKDMTISQAIHSGITELFHEGLCTDFEITVGGRVFRCHKVVLAAVSDYFKAMFESGMEECIHSKATFEDLSPKVFEYIFELLHPLNDDTDFFAGLPEDEVYELLRVADMLQIKILKEKCCAYFKNTMSPKNCVDHWKMGKSIMNKEITELAWKFILKSFQQVFNEDMLVSLGYDEFLSIVKDENLAPGSEYTVWKAIRRWVVFDEANRMEYFVDLLRECALTELNGDILFEEVAFDPLVRQNDEASKLVRKAIQFYRHPVERSALGVKLRKRERLLVLVGTMRKDKTKSKHAKTMVLSTRHINFRSVCTLDIVNDSLAVCALDMILYATSGQRFAKYEYVPKSGECNICQWTPLIDLPFPLKFHMMVATDTDIYVMGGKSGCRHNSKVLQYNIEKKSWDIVGTLLTPVRNASSVSTRYNIYIFGGTISSGKAVDYIQQYDIDKKVCTTICRMPKPCPYSQATRVDNNVYIVTCHGDIVHFSLYTNTAQLIGTFPEFSRDNFGIFVDMGTLRVYGGRSLSKYSNNNKDIQEVEYYKNILMFDLTTRQISSDRPFANPVEVFGCASIVSSYSRLPKKS